MKRPRHPAAARWEIRLGTMLLVSLLGLLPVSASGDEDLPFEIRFRNHSEIFSPQAAITLEVTPKPAFRDPLLSLSVSLYRTVDAETSSTPTFRKRSDSPRKELLFEQETTLSSDTGPSMISFPAPGREGVYEIALALHRRQETTSGTLWSFSALPLQRRAVKPLAETSVQCVVVNPNPLPRPLGYDDAAIHKELLETIDPGGPNIWKRRASIPGFPKVAAKIPELPKIPEIPKFHGFRERPSNDPPPAAANPSPPTPPKMTSIRSASGEAPSFLESLVEQWSSGAGPHGSGHFKSLGISLSEPPSQDAMYSVLAPAESAEIESWEAFPLTVREIGKPHLLEVDYPDGVPQTLGIGVVEFPHRDDGTAPLLSVDSGVYYAEELVPAHVSGSTRTHRVLFWPKTKQPILMLSNRDRIRDAVFGKIRLYRVAGQSAVVATNRDAPRLPQRFAEKRERLVAGYIHRPDFLEFLASPPEQASPEPSTSDRLSASRTSTFSSDWTILYEGAGRLVDLLFQGGYEGVMMNVASKDAVLYPSKCFGAFSEKPSEKDGLELLLRLFDRDRLVLIPSIDFDGPLNSVEEFLRRNPSLAGEILPGIGEGGNTTPLRGVPRYNLLHPVVQEAMIDAVRELLGRCSRHQSFGGIGVLLTPESCARLADPFRQFDDRTLRQFEQETEIALPEEITASGSNVSPTRFEARARYFRTTPSVAEAWVQWRTRKVGEFYARLSRTIIEIRPDTRLYLSGATMLDQPELAPFCAPALSRRIPLFQALRSLGFDPTWIADIPSLTFLRPNRMSSDPESEAAIVYRDFESIDLGSLPPHVGATPGVLFFHETDAGFTPIPSGIQNRRRFVKQLAQTDFPIFFDGGFSLPTGEGDALDDLLATYRRLPILPYETFRPKTENRVGGVSPNDASVEPSLQPLTVRYAKTPAGMILYLTNDAPFQIDAVLTFSLSETSVTSPVELGGRRPVEPFSFRDGTARWPVSLRPYDLIAVRLPDPGAVLHLVDVRRPKTICGAGGTLEQKVERLRERIQAARFGVPWEKLENAGFEPGDGTSEDLIGWNRFGGDSFSARFDDALRHEGRSSLKLHKNSTPVGETGIVLSNPFPSPPTGRLFVSVLLSTPDKTPPVPLNIVLAAKHHGQPFIRSFRVELPGASRWQRRIAAFDRLPIKEFEELRIGFEMTAPGTVWVDDLTLYQVAFTKDETNELFRLISAADLRCSTNRTSDLLTILEGHWAQFLFRYVPERAPDKTANIPTPTPAEPSKPYAGKAETTPHKPESTGIVDRLRGWFSPREAPTGK